MSFKTLEQRYQEKVNDLYQGATSKFENGKPSRGANDDPIIVRKPGDGYFGGASRALGRFLPVSSTVQDVKRLTLFTFSTRGAVFLAKQFLLQTGNTFESTRLLNPAFTIANAVPFLHIRRHLTPRALLSGLIGKTDTSTRNVRGMGQLQQETYDKALGRPASLLGSIKSAVTSKKNVAWPSGLGLTGFDMSATWRISRPELGSGNIDSYIYTKQNRSSYVFKFGGRMTSSFGAVYANLFTYENDTKYLKNEVYADEPTDASLKRRPNYTFTAKRKDLLNPSSPDKLEIAYTLPKRIIDEQVEDYRTTNRQQWEGFIRVPGRFTLNYHDSGQNRLDLKAAAARRDKFPYDSFQEEFDDFIRVKIQMGNGTPIQFRAYLKDLQQSINPQYKEFQYIGRTEKFINYSGAQREASFKLAVLAAHPDELKEVWKRINYLTGLAFPYAVSNGIYQPNIMKLTIGKVFVDQPAYITSLSTNFSEIMESWDIDEEVPMSAQIDMKCVLIEKTQKVANSPFYGITENYFKEEYRERVASGLAPRTDVPEIRG
jgi:hypothetical protein